MKKLQKLMDGIKEWSDKTLMCWPKSDKRQGIISYLRKEIEELDYQVITDEEKGNNRLVVQEELADCMMLLLDVANHSGIDAESLLFEIENKLRVRHNYEKLQKSGELKINKKK